jgi:hypothetical protein
MRIRNYREPYQPVANKESIDYYQRYGNEYKLTGRLM